MICKNISSKHFVVATRLLSDTDRINNATVQNTILYPICSICSSSQSYLEGIKRKWLLSCSQETRKVTICQHHLMSFILPVSSGRRQTLVPGGQSVTQTAAPNTAQTLGQKTAVSTSRPNHFTDYTDYTDYTDLAVLETGWVDPKKWYKTVYGNFINTKWIIKEDVRGRILSIVGHVNSCIQLLSAPPFETVNMSVWCLNYVSKSPFHFLI